MNILELFISIIPIYLIALYVYKKDREKEPKKLLIKLFIFGLLLSIPIFIIELMFSSLFGNSDNMNVFLLILYIIVGISFVEEICKWLVIYKFTYNHKEFNQPYDAIVYAVFIALGFACLENVLYVLSYGFSVGILRAFTAIPGHAADAIIMGNFLAMAKLAELSNNIKNRRKYILLSIFIPIITHGIYDFCLFYDNLFFIIFFAFFVVLLYIISIRKIKRVVLMNDNFTK